MAKQYTSVSALIRDVAPDAETSAATEKRILDRKLIKQLVAMRALRELSQKDIAKQLNCTQSRVSKFEQSLDEDVKLSDLRAYSKAVGCEFCSCITSQSIKPVDKVKAHVFAIKKHMDDLATLANSDEKIAEGVVGFFSELLFNFTRLFGDSVKRLPLAPNGLPYIDVRLAESCQCEDELSASAEPLLSASKDGTKMASYTP
jgi:transcriptional regulator with XRE-family HTH domain